MSADLAQLRAVMASTRPTPARTMPVVGWRAQSVVGAAMALVYLLAVGTRQDQIVIAIVGLAAVTSVASPVTGLAMLVVIMPMQEPELLVPLRPAGILAGAIALGCIFRLPRDRLSIKFHPGILLLLGYLSISAVSLLPWVSGYPPDWTGSAANELWHIAVGATLFLSAAYLFRLVPYRVFLALGLAGATMAALLAIGDFIQHPPFQNLYDGLLSMNVSLRASGGFSDANYLGLYMAPTAVFVLGAILVARRSSRLLLVPVAVLLLAAVAVTFSREAYLSVAVGVVILAASRSRVLAVVVAIIIAVVAVALYPLFLEARLGAVVNSREQLALLAGEDSRRAVAGAAFAMFASSPVFGVGFGFFHFISPLYSGAGAAFAAYSHNQFLSVIAEQGIVGIVLVAGLVMLLFRAIMRSRHRLRSAALAMGAAYLVVSLFVNSATSFQGSSLVWLVMAAVLTPIQQKRVTEV